MNMRHFNGYYQTKGNWQTAIDSWKDSIPVKVVFKDGVEKEMIYNDVLNFEKDYGDCKDYTYDEFKERMVVIKL